MSIFKDNILVEHKNLIHTTPLGEIRISKNLFINSNDVIAYCLECLNHANKVERIGKNWYVYYGNIKITINAHNYCIITAHISKK